MFAGNLTYEVQSSDPEAIIPHLFMGFDASFAENLDEDDIILGGDNFGCGSSREHPAVGLAYKGVKAVIVKSVNRIFYRSSVNQGLPLIVLPDAVKAYKKGNSVDIDFTQGTVRVGESLFHFEPLPEKLLEILEMKGLVNWIRNQ
jgi:3-isopropylmalate dehydratase small subunit